MSATVRCEICGLVAFARVIEDDWSTNAFECEPDWASAEADTEYGYTVIDGKPYVFMCEDVECKLFESLCQHEDYETLEVEYDYD